MGKRIEYLDSLRGLAALAVIFSHFFGGYGGFFNWGNAPIIHPLRIVYDGATAVSLFFVLSGFVLAWRHEMTLGLKGHESFSLGSFYILRITRIFPAFWFALLLSAVCYRYLYVPYETRPPASEWALGIWSHDFSLVDVLKQATLNAGTPHRLLPQDWTLREEVRYSFLMPILILIATRSSVWLMVFCALAIGGFRLSSALFQFSLGVLIAKHHLQLDRIFRRWPRWVPACCLLFAVVLCEAHHCAQTDGLRKFLQWYVGGVGVALLLVCVLQMRTLQQFLSIRVLRFFGQISYSVYLFHFTILLTVTPFCIRQLNNAGVQGDNLIRFIALAIMLGLTIILSTISYYLVEKPGIRLGKILSNQFAALRSRRSPAEEAEPVLEALKP